MSWRENTCAEHYCCTTTLAKDLKAHKSHFVVPQSISFPLLQLSTFTSVQVDGCVLEAWRAAWYFVCSSTMGYQLLWPHFVAGPDLMANLIFSTSNPITPEMKSERSQDSQIGYYRLTISLCVGPTRLLAERFVSSTNWSSWLQMGSFCFPTEAISE